MTIDATERMTSDSGVERTELRQSGRDPLVTAQPTRPAGGPRNDSEDAIPIKQVLRWQDDGGAIVPSAS